MIPLVVRGLFRTKYVMRILGLCLLLVVLSLQAVADGKVFAQSEVRAVVTIPNQQALIVHREGVQHLVIETAFLGHGTNFAWVVPLPAEPVIQPVSPEFFPSLQQAFQPQLRHYVPHYYAGILFVCGLAFLAWRSLKDEVEWFYDLPLCLVLAAGIGLVGRSAMLAIGTLIPLIVIRLFTRSTTIFAVVVLLGIMFSVGLAAFLSARRFNLITTLDATSVVEEANGVSVLSLQRAGIFESTTIRGNNPRAILEWLEAHGYDAPTAIEPAVEDYVKRGWVFVASKAFRPDSNSGSTSLHPLAFSFTTPTAVYPLKLTGVGNDDCLIDLFIFGDDRGDAPGFKVARCDYVMKNMPDQKSRRWQSGLQINNEEVLKLIGSARVGTKLSARLNAKQMADDTTIVRRTFSKRGATVYSQTGALIAALNVAIPIATFGWLLISASRGGWGVDERFVRRWRSRIILAAIIIGGVVFLLLPKTAIAGG